MALAQFISLEGLEGVGKSTHLQAIQATLTSEKIPFLMTREPGGTPLAETLREILLAHREEILFPETELLLMMAARVQHLRHVIQPALARGEWVICDRFVDASYAYQGGGAGLSLAWIDQIAERCVEGIWPDATLLFDAPWSVGKSRIQNRPHDRIESREDDYFERVRSVYLARAQTEPSRFHIFDANQSTETVRETVCQWLKTYIQTWRNT